MFKKSAPQSTPKPRERASTPQRGVPDGAISIIGVGMTVIGDVTTEGIVRVEGIVRGTIRAGKSVILGQGGLVDGNIFTEDAVIGGSVEGSIVAANRLELQKTCSVSGEIRTRSERLKFEEGARFGGQIQMLDEGGESIQVGFGANTDRPTPTLVKPDGPKLEPADERELAAASVGVERQSFGTGG